MTLRELHKALGRLQDELDSTKRKRSDADIAREMRQVEKKIDEYDRPSFDDDTIQVASPRPGERWDN
jgi:hypothetical protein